MSDYLSLDWEAHQISGLEAATSRQGVTVRKAFVFTWPDNIDLEKDTQQAAHWLKSQLAQSGISTKSVLVSLPRESIVVRRLTVPNVPEEELPPLVQMQAATKSSTPVDQLELDFLPLPMDSQDGGRDVLMCTMARKRSGKIRAILEGAGLEIEGIGISSIAAAELVAREDKSRKLATAENSLIIARHGERVEISLLHDQQVIFLHSTQIHGDEDHPYGNETMIVTEVQRSMISLHPQSGPFKIDRAWLVGEEEEVSELAATVEKRFKCETTTVNPIQASGVNNHSSNWPGQVAAYAGPLGLVFGKVDPIIKAIDFQNPRKERSRRNVQKLQKIAAAVALGVLFVVAMGYRWWKVQDLQTEITTKRAKIDQLKQVIKAGEPTMKAAGVVGEWDQKTNREMAQFGQLQSALPGTDLMYLVKYQLLPAPRNALANIQAEVRAKAETDARELLGRLAERGIKVKPPKFVQSNDSDYPVQFQLDLELPLPAPEKPAAKTPQS